MQEPGSTDIAKGTTPETTAINNPKPLHPQQPLAVTNSSPNMQPLPDQGLDSHQQMQQLAQDKNTSAPPNQITNEHNPSVQKERSDRQKLLTNLLLSSFYYSQGLPGTQEHLFRILAFDYSQIPFDEPMWDKATQAVNSYVVGASKNNQHTPNLANFEEEAEYQVKTMRETFAQHKSTDSLEASQERFLLEWLDRDRQYVEFGRPIEDPYKSQVREVFVSHKVRPGYEKFFTDLQNLLDRLATSPETSLSDKQINIFSKLAAWQFAYRSKPNALPVTFPDAWEKRMLQLGVK